MTAASAELPKTWRLGFDATSLEENVLRDSGRVRHDIDAANGEEAREHLVQAAFAEVQRFRDSLATNPEELNDVGYQALQEHLRKHGEDDLRGRLVVALRAVASGQEQPFRVIRTDRYNPITSGADLGPDASGALFGLD